MLRKQLQTDNGFFVSEGIDGALFKADIGSIPDSAFSTKGVNKPISSLGIAFSGISYAKPRMGGDHLYCNFGERVQLIVHLKYLIDRCTALHQTVVISL